MKWTIDPKGSLPPSDQIAARIRAAVASAEIAPGDRLPSVRQIATDALVNPNTVARAIRQLEWEHVVETRPGDGVFVANGAADICKQWRDGEIRTRLARALEDARAAGLAQGQLLVWIGELIRDQEEADFRKQS